MSRDIFSIQVLILRICGLLFNISSQKDSYFLTKHFVDFGLVLRFIIKHYSGWLSELHLVVIDQVFVAVSQSCQWTAFISCPNTVNDCHSHSM